MRRSSRTLLTIIILLTIFAVLVNIPTKIPVSFDFTNPLTHRTISIHKTFPGFNPNFTIAGIHFQNNFPIKKGLDLEGGTSITLRANMDNIPEGQRNNALDAAQNVIEKRVNFYGVSEPVVQTAKTNSDYRIIVELPGVTDVNAAVSLIGRTAKLTFWEEGASSSAKEKVASSSANLPYGITYFLQNPHQTNLSGSDLRSSTVTFDPNTGKPQVQLSFTSDGAGKFAAITQRNVGKPLAMVLDNMLIEVPPPTVSQPILSGNAVINGSFTIDQAKNLAIQLNAGALPVSLSVLQEQSVGATLGQVSLEESLFAGVLGFFVIIIFMCSLYGRLGVIASMALTIYTLLVLAFFRTGFFIFPPITLTLAGIAGFILSIGIAVDANILIFERMREELRKGKAVSVALEQGFSRAWISIRDSNIASLITSSILYYFGTGIIRGFALTLATGVFISLFSAIVVTRTFLKIFYKG